MQLQLSRKQNDFIRSATHRWNIKTGAARSGKSFTDVAYTVPSRLRERHGKDGLNIIIGVSRETIERNVLQPMREIYTDRVVGTINNRNMARICGEDVYCLGAEKVNQVAKIQGSSIKYCYGDEVAKWNREVFAMLESRLDKTYSCFDGTCNPEYPGHWLKEFIDRDDIDCYVQKYTIFDNPYLPPEFVRNLCKEYAGTVYYRRLIEGEWAKAEGLVYPMHEDAVMDIPGAAERSILSIDYGTLNAFAAQLWQLYKGVWYLTSEYYYSGRDTGIQKTDEEYATALDQWLERKLGASWTVRNRLKTIIDPSAASFITLLWKRSKYYVIPADNAVLDGIRQTASCMQTGRIKVSPSCKNWISEVQGYVWEENDSVDRPLKVNDHAMDAMRYFVKTMNIQPQAEATYIPIHMRG